MDTILGEREQQVHYREWEEDTCVDEDPPHCSVRKACVGERSADATATFASLVTPRIERQYVSEADAAVSASRQAFRVNLSRIEEPRDERTREAENLCRLCGSEDRLGREHGDRLPAREFAGACAHDLNERCRQRDAPPIRERRIEGSDSWTKERRDELVGELRSTPGLYRLLRRTGDGKLRIDKTKVANEARFDGKFLLRSSDDTLSATDLALAYKQLVEVERGWVDDGPPKRTPTSRCWHWDKR